MKNMGESGVKLLDLRAQKGKLMVIKQYKYCCESVKEPSKKHCNRQHGAVQVVRSDEGHLIFSKYLSRFE